MKLAATRLRIIAMISKVKKKKNGKIRYEYQSQTGILNIQRKILFLLPQLIHLIYSYVSQISVIYQKKKSIESNETYVIQC